MDGAPNFEKRAKLGKNERVISAVIAIIPSIIASILTALVTLKGASKEVVAINRKLEESHKKANAIEDDLAGVPIGGVIAWWGDWGDSRKRPKGFELCDGTTVTTPGSSIIGQEKPKLIGRFIKGAGPQNFNVAANKIMDGIDVLRGVRTEGTSLTVSQLPGHSHGSITSENGSHGIQPLVQLQMMMVADLTHTSLWVTQMLAGHGST